MQNCKILIGRDNTLIIEDGVLLINTEINISGSGHTVVLKKGCKITRKGRIRVEDTGNTIVIGSNTHISGAFLSASDYNTEIEIGEDCLFSANIIIRTSDGHSILNSEDTRINPGQDVTIGNKVWIGYGATILKGASIGDNCIVGTEAVVPGKTYPAGSVIAGTPAKVVKTDIHWCTERIKTEK